MGQNYKHLTELHSCTLTSLSYLWAVGIWVIVKVRHPTGPIKILKNVIVLMEVFSDCAFIWEKLCDELMKIYMIKSVLLLKNPCQFSTNLEMVNCELGPTFGAEFQDMWKTS